ncbi:helix-turn-helix domain-containing protein [Humibacillus xanthopallidus]|uniref:Excisionase family DNA binding protein n=1 Tax=Humibacillus xanthopallidus TaxID=412689 RepID=A0A543HTT7_9MICO|nr:helix-turn-helix domain-containing protein [Humibacillus xanthopallidus]TQM61712.1 excisionase family DNA binding protein [Humibacillus xanthopallidus]
MSTTTALDLLELADVQIRRLRHSEVAATTEQWESFDVTLHRLLLELTGPDAGYVQSQDPSRNALTIAVRTYPKPLRHPINTQLRTAEVAAYLNTTKVTVVRRVHRGALHAVKDGSEFRYASSSIDDRPDIRPSDPTDPHPLSRASCALGTMADLIRESRDHGPAVLERAGEVAGAALHLLSLAAVAARHTLAHGSLDDAIRPVLIGRYAERVIDSLRDAALQPASLDRLTSVQPERIPTSLNDRLEAALHAWQGSVRQEISQLIPSVDVLRQIANQGAHLCQVLAAFEPASSDSARHLHAAALALTQGDRAWGRLTTLARPSYQFVAASRELFETLSTVAKAFEHPTLNKCRVVNDLSSGVAVVSDLMILTRSLPDRLLAANVLWGPARALRHTDDRLHDRDRGRLVRVDQADAPDLTSTWETATGFWSCLPQLAPPSSAVHPTL